MSRKYFGTDGIRGEVGSFPITPEFVLKLGWAAGRVLGQAGHGKVVIGKDTRISGYMFESVLEAGLSAAGQDVLLLGPMPTPAVAYLTRTLHASAGIVISASHNPYHDNGIKFFGSDGQKLDDEVEQAIEAAIDEDMSLVPSASLGKARRVVDAPGRYIEFCKSSFPNQFSLNGLKMVVDCAHGATYHIAPSVFAELGAEVISHGVTPDGLNINVDCGSTAPAALQQRVLAEQADVGIALDGDGDRVLMVDHKGELVDGDELLFIIARAMSLPDDAGVVGTVMTNLGMEHALQREGIAFARAKVGDRYVMEQLKQKGWTLGGESSGHLIALEHTTTGDGIISALQVLRAMVGQDRSLHELKGGMVKYPQTMINVIKSDDTFNIDTSERVQQAVAAVTDTLQGRGRVLLRPSGTEPLIRVMIEGEDGAEVERLCRQLASEVEQAMQETVGR